jgi:hypothetical protein
MIRVEVYVDAGEYQGEHLFHEEVLDVTVDPHGNLDIRGSSDTWAHYPTGNWAWFERKQVPDPDPNGPLEVLRRRAAERRARFVNEEK